MMYPEQVFVIHWDSNVLDNRGIPFRYTLLHAPIEQASKLLALPMVTRVWITNEQNKTQWEVAN